MIMLPGWMTTPPAWFRVHDDDKANAENWQGTLLVFFLIIMPMIIIIIVAAIV